MDSVMLSNCKKAVKQIERNNRERLLLNNWSLTISIHHFTASSLFRRHTIYDIRNTKKFDQMRRYPKDKNGNFKIFLTFLKSLPNNDLSLLYPLYAVRYTLFFVPNAQVRPFIERRCFSAPQFLILSFGFEFLSRRSFMRRQITL
jgi:hypothetical protein